MRVLYCTAYGRFLVQGVEHASILDVYSVPYADWVYVTPQHGAEPDAAIPSRLDVANDNRIVRQKTILPDFGSESSYWFY